MTTALVLLVRDITAWQLWQGKLTAHLSCSPAQTSPPRPTISSGSSEKRDQRAAVVPKTGKETPEKGGSSMGRALGSRENLIGRRKRRLGSLPVNPDL